MRALLLLALTLVAFAANSVLARIALKGIEGEAYASPMGFTLIRLVSGAIVLIAIVGIRPAISKIMPMRALALGLYALCFSISYVMIDAGTGALILFGAVQLTMLSGGFMAGERLNMRQIIGASLAIFGLIVLLRPAISTPSAQAAILMIISGIGWGVYSLQGRASANPRLETAQNFVGASVLAIMFSIPYLILNPEPQITSVGIGLAVTSGAVTSGLGYVLWYYLLQKLTATRAALSQLSVPAIAALGGVIFLAEPVTPLFILASVLVLGGVAIAIAMPNSSKAR